MDSIKELIQDKFGKLTPEIMINIETYPTDSLDNLAICISRANSQHDIENILVH